MRVWAIGDLARWQGIDCTVEHVSTSDGALISYRRPGEELKHAIVSVSDLTERPANGPKKAPR